MIGKIGIGNTGSEAWKLNPPNRSKSSGSGVSNKEEIFVAHLFQNIIRVKFCELNGKIGTENQMNNNQRSHLQSNNSLFTAPSRTNNEEKRTLEAMPVPVPFTPSTMLISTQTDVTPAPEVWFYYFQILLWRLSTRLNSKGLGSWFRNHT